MLAKDARLILYHGYRPRTRRTHPYNHDTPLFYTKRIDNELEYPRVPLGEEINNSDRILRGNGAKPLPDLLPYRLLKQRYRIRSISSKYRLIQVYADPDDGAIQIMPRQVVLNQHSANLLVFPVNIVRPLHGDMIRI